MTPPLNIGFFLPHTTSPRPQQPPRFPRKTHTGAQLKYEVGSDGMGFRGQAVRKGGRQILKSEIRGLILVEPIQSAQVAYLSSVFGHGQIRDHFGVWAFSQRVCGRSATTNPELYRTRDSLAILSKQGKLSKPADL
jgi:hypothetical protein